MAVFSPMKLTVKAWISLGLVLVVGLLVVWKKTFHTENASSDLPDQSSGATVGELTGAEVGGDPQSEHEMVSLHPAAESLARQWEDPQLTTEDDMQVLQKMLQFYQRSFGGNPEGDNADVVQALLGQNRQNIHFLLPDSRFIRDGLLLDRWGTPYFLHPESSHQMTIRSAGPDLEMFSEDDLILE